MDFSLIDNTTGKLAGIAILDHPSNLRHPSKWHCVMDGPLRFGYFNPAPLFSEPYTLAAGQTLALRYRILIHAGRGNPEQIDQAWKAFSGAR